MGLKVKVIGAGSIGTHLTQAARRMGWQVSVVDRDKEALRRMKEEIYPSRYGSWDPSIQLFNSEQEPRGGFDLICVGTPPDARMPIAIRALSEGPRTLLLEKPLCPPRLDQLEVFSAAYAIKSSITRVFVGYNHAVSKSISFVSDLLSRNTIGKVETLDVEFRESWEGIFAAHPWLSGPQDSYLGFWHRGGGAGGEHSHALHLWLYLASLSQLGEPLEVLSTFDMVKEGVAWYDRLASFTFRTSSGRVGRVIQDVITKPTRKWARLQGTEGFIEWRCNGAPEGDLVVYSSGGIKERRKLFKKKRADDFLVEMKHIENYLTQGLPSDISPISFESGAKVMSILSQAYKRVSP